MSASTSGFKRTETGATTPKDDASSATTSSSPSDSTFSERTPASSAARISSRRLPTPEKTIRSAGHARLQRLLQLPARDDVGAQALLRGDADERERVVRLERVADQVRRARERRPEAADPLPEEVGVVRVERRADGLGDVLEGLHA